MVVFGNDVQALDVRCAICEIERPIYVTSVTTALVKNSPFLKIFNRL